MDEVFTLEHAMQARAAINNLLHDPSLQLSLLDRDGLMGQDMALARACAGIKERMTELSHQIDVAYEVLDGVKESL